MTGTNWFVSLLANVHCQYGNRASTFPSRCQLQKPQMSTPSRLVTKQTKAAKTKRELHLVLNFFAQKILKNMNKKNRITDGLENAL